jgi:hypothetical protein
MGADPHHLELSSIYRSFIAAFIDLVWATFWLPGIVPKAIGLIQITLGAAVAVWLFQLLFGDKTEGTAPWQNPFTLPVTAAGFCLAAVASASGIAWVIYAVLAQSWRRPSARWLSSVGLQRQLQAMCGSQFNAWGQV